MTLAFKSRLGNEALGDISNLDGRGEIMSRDDRRRAYGLGNRLSHTDASFQDPPGRYSMLSAKVIPPATMHRARPFDDARYRRELHRVTTLDIEPALVAGGA